MALNWDKLNASKLNWDKLDEIENDTSDKKVNSNNALKFKTLEEAKQYAEENGINYTTDLKEETPSLKLFNNEPKNIMESGKQAIAKNMAENAEEHQSVGEKFYNNVITPMNEFNSSMVYNIGALPAKGITKLALTAGEAIGGAEHPWQRAQEKTNELFGKLENAGGFNKDTTANKAGKVTGQAIQYLGMGNELAKSFGGKVLGNALGYGVTSATNAFANTNDVGDIAMEGALGGAYGTISGLTNKGIVSGIEKIFPATSPLFFGATMNTAGNIAKNVIAGAGGAYAGTATTGEARNIYNALRGREVTKEDWVKPVWSAETGVTTLIGGISGGLSGTMADKQVRTKYIKDVNDLQGKLKIYAEKFNSSIQNGDEQSALDIARISRDELVKFSMNDYGGRTVDQTAMNDLTTKWKNYLENSVKYNNYMRSNAYANSNVQAQLSNPELNNIFAQYNGKNNNVQAQPSSTQSTTQPIALQGATPNAEQTIANNVPNALKNVQNQPNIVQNSQNNVQNALNFEKTGQKSQVTLPNEIQSFVENRNKVAPGLSVQMDNTLNTDGVIVQNQDGTRTIKINPSSNNAYEFVTMHEMLHDLSGTQEYQELANFVKERAMTHDTFEESKQTITDKYTKYYQENGLDMSSLDMDIETINDMTAQALGNQDFLNELASKKPNVFMRIWNWIKNVLFDGQKTGKTFSERRADNKYLNELKKKFETAYNTAYKGNGETKYSIQTDNNGNKYVKVDTDQNIFEGVEKKDYPKIARMYMQDYLKGNTALGNNSTANIGNKGISKYTNPIQQTQYKNEKMKLSTELNNILAVSEKVSEGLPTKDTSKFPNWEYYKVNFEIDGKTFEGLINIGVDKNGNKHFYDINKIRITSNSHISASKSSNTDFINYSIPSTEGTVNNQYMQNSPNNAEEHYSIGGNGYSGHSMSNNAIKAYEEGKKPISKFTKEDVNTFNQLLQERGISEKITLKELKTLLEKYSGSEWHHTSSRYNKTNFYDINDVLENDNSDIENTIKEIRDSKEKSANVKEILKTKLGETEKEYYTRIGNYVIDKRIKNYNKDGLNFLAVQEEESRKNPSYVYGVGRASGVLDYGAKYTPQGLENSSSFSLPETDNQGRKLTKEQQEYFKDSKVRDENGNLLTMYHGTPNGNFTVFNSGSYFTPNKEYASGYQRGNASILNYGKEETNPRTYEVYLNIANPFTLSNPIAKDIYINEYIKGGHALGINPYLSDTEYDKIQSIDWTEGEDLKEFLIENNYDYDGLILDEGGMGGYDEEVKNRGNSYVIFDAKQVKSVDNTTPTNNSDIRYSQSDKSWSNYLKEYWDLMPNSTKTFGLPTSEELQAFDNEQSKKAYDSLHKLEDIADMTEDDIRNEKGVNYKHKKDKGTKNERKFFENAKTSETINNDIKESIDVTTYERQSNAETLEKAKNKLDEQGDKLIKQWETKTKNFTAEDVAIGAILIERYQQLGDNESAVNVVQKLADMGTEVGRAVQMYSIFQRLTPEAMMIYQQRKLNDVFKEISQRKTGEWVEQNKDKFKLTSEDSKFITERVEKAQQATSEREKQIELAKIEKRINDKLPPERGQTIKAIRRIAMLFNPKTQVRNVVGNALIMPVNDVTDIIGTQIDKLIAKKTGVRTTNYANLKEKGKGIKKGLSEAVQDYKMGIRTEPSGSKYEFNFGGKSFNENTKSKAVNFVNNKLNGIENLLGAVMSGGDRPFYEAAFNNSLQGQMEANNVTTPTTEMIDIAVNEALSRTWNDSNAYTEAVLGVRRQMNKLNIGGFGLGDLIIPFAKTPANLTKAIVEYSPVGLVEAIYDYVDMKKAISRGEMTAIQQKKFVNSISKAVAGSILYLIAGTLAHTGAITGSADDDKDVKNFEQNVLGIQPYSIKIGDKTFTYSWANPLNAPLAIMADTYKMSKNNENWFDILTNAFKTAGEVVVDNSFLQGIKELFEADSISEGLVDAVLDMPSQFIPTFLSQFATLFDKNKRQTFEYGDKLKTSVNQMKTKIPGFKNTLAPTVNTFGEEVENYGGDNNIFNVFLNPANVSEANATDTQKELYALYEATKDKTIFPRQAPYYLKDDGEKINLSSEERTEYQKTSGQYVTENLGALLDSEFYKSLDNEDKVELINEVISDADTVAKDKWIDTKTTEKVSSRNKELDEAGIPLIDYYNAWFAKKEAENKKKAQITAINEAVSDDLTVSQRKQLYKILNVD